MFKILLEINTNGEGYEHSNETECVTTEVDHGKSMRVGYHRPETKQINVIGATILYDKQESLNTRTHPCLHIFHYIEYKLYAKMAS